MLSFLARLLFVSLLSFPLSDPLWADTPLGSAIRNNDKSAVRSLLNAEADPNAASLSGVNALSAAIRSCKAGMNIVEMLIDAGADIENRSGVGITPVTVAIQEKRTDPALFLLESGADLNTLNPYGEGLLNYAIYIKNPILIQAVMNRGINTHQLRKLFTTVDYDPPGFLDTPSHLEVICT